MLKTPDMLSRYIHRYGEICRYPSSHSHRNPDERLPSAGRKLASTRTKGAKERNPQKGSQATRMIFFLLSKPPLIDWQRHEHTAKPANCTPETVTGNCDKLLRTIMYIHTIAYRRYTHVIQVAMSCRLYHCRHLKSALQPKAGLPSLADPTELTPVVITKNGTTKSRVYRARGSGKLCSGVPQRTDTLKE